MITEEVLFLGVEGVEAVEGGVSASKSISAMTSNKTIVIVHITK
jgi:hypothetical protein